MALKEGPLAESSCVEAELCMRLAFSYLEAMCSWSLLVYGDPSDDPKFQALSNHVYEFKKWFGDTDGHGKLNVPWDTGGRFAVGD